MSTRAQLLSEIAAQFPDNTTGAITPAKLRQVTEDIANSCAVPAAGTGTITAADITDLASGRGPLLTGTNAQACGAIGAQQVASLSPGIVLVGSSSFAYEGYGPNGVGATVQAARGCVNNGIALSGSRVRVLANLAINSTLVADHEAQFVAALALNPQAICMQPFSNDIVNGVTAATLNPYQLSWAERCAARGIHLIIRSSHWRSMTAAQMKEYMKIRQLTRELSLGNSWVHNIDGFGDFQDDTSLVGACRANYTVEGLHPSNLGAYANGKSYAALFSQLFAPLPYHYADAYDENLVGDQWLRNPTLGISGGTLGANCTGAAPKYWQLDIPTVASRSDGLTTTVAGSVITDTDGRKAYRIDITNAIIGDSIRLYHPQGYTASTATGIWEVGCIVRNVSGTILTQPEFSCGGARTLNRDGITANIFALLEPAEFTLIQRTPTINSGSYQSAYLYLTPRNSTAGNATVVVKSPYCRWIGA